MQKITEITETRFKTVREKDASGKRIPKQVSYQGYRNVNVISGGKRFAHAFVDGIVYYVLYYFINFIYLHAVSFDQNNLGAILGSFLIALIFIFLFPVYYIVFEHFFQRTPGKFLTKAVVVDIYGNKPEIGANVLRNIIRIVPFESFSCLFSERGWHDRWSDTFVISEDEYAKIKELLAKKSNESIDMEIEGDVKPVNSKMVKNVFLFIVLPLSFIIYIGILIISYSGANKALNKLENIKDRNETEGSSERDEITYSANLYNEGKIDEAQSKLLAFTKIHKNYYLAWTILGHTYLDQSKFEEAIDAYRNAIKANKNSYEPHNGLGMAYSGKKDYTKAKYEYRVADSITPNNGTVIANMASLYDDIGDIKRAIQLGIRSVQLDSTNSILEANLAAYYHTNNQFSERNKMMRMAKRQGYESMKELADMFYPNKTSEGYLNISGVITKSYSDSIIENAKIEVLNGDSIIIKEIFTDNEGHYDFSLPVNDADIYTVKITNPNCFYKYYTISTKNIPPNQQKRKFARIEADLGLSEVVKGVDYSFLNKPLNSYYYNPAKNNFEYDKALLESSIKKLQALQNAEKKQKQHK